MSPNNISIRDKGMVKQVDRRKKLAIFINTNDIYVNTMLVCMYVYRNEIQGYRKPLL